MPKLLEITDQTHCCHEAVLGRIVEKITEMCVSNADDIEKIVVEADGMARTANFRVKWDKSSGFPMIDVKMQMAPKALKDGRHISAEDPNQLTLPGTEVQKEPEQPIAGSVVVATGKKKKKDVE